MITTHQHDDLDRRRLDTLKMDTVQTVMASRDVEREVLQDYLYNEIPITKLMGIRVALCNERVIILKAPLDINHNDKNTAFGGSLATVLTVAGWSVTHMTLRRLGFENTTTLLRRSKIDYLKPVKEDIFVVANFPDQQAIETLQRDLQARDKGRWDINARVEAQQHLAVDFNGTYVALLQSSNEL